MNDPKRLLAPDGDTATGFERQLLQAVLDERPSEAATQRMLEATLAAGTATAPSVAGMGAGAWFASTAVAVGIAGLAAAVWLGGSGTAEEAAHAPPNAPPIGAANEGTTRDAASTRTDQGDRPSSVDVEHDAMEPAATKPAAPGAPSQQAIPGARGSATPEAQDATTGSAREERTQAPSGAGANPARSSSGAAAARTPRERADGSSAAPSDETSRTLREEVQLLDGARSALRAGDASGAFAALARYDRRFPSGMLRKESALLRQRASALTNENPDER